MDICYYFYGSEIIDISRTVFQYLALQEDVEDALSSDGVGNPAWDLDV